jgi:LysR family nitrogen assimilation transcriptional regulator
MDFRQLRYFVKIAEAKNFTRAAEVLHVAQPALSNQILRLEEEIREKLFLRHSRGIELTEAGHRLLRHARQILDQIDVARDEVRGPASKPEGLIRIGMPRSVSEVLAVKLVQEAKKKYPAVTIQIVEHFSETLNALLRDRAIDLALTYGLATSDLTISDAMLEERLYLISHATSKIAKRREVEFNRAAQLPLILGSSTHVVRKLLTDAAARNRVTLNVIHEIDSPQTALSMVEGHLGHTIVPLPAAIRAVKSGSVVARRIVHPEIVRKLHIARSANQISTRTQLAIGDLLLELTQGHVKHRKKGSDAPI